MRVMAVQIRPAFINDVPVILEMIRGLAEYEKLSHLVTATEDLLAQSLFGERPAAEVLLAFSGENAAGFVLFFPNYSTFLARPGIYLEDLFVKPEFRGEGIGFALLKELAMLAVSRGCARVEWSVLDWNEPSIGFYKKLGAMPMNDWTTFRLTGEALQRLAGLAFGGFTLRVHILDPAIHHFGFARRAPTHRLRRIRIQRIVFRIIEHGRNLQPGALRDEDRVGGSISNLPIEVVIRERPEPFPYARPDKSCPCASPCREDACAASGW